MAKRKRLSPAVGIGTGDATPAPSGARPPIASIAGDAATAAAFDSVRAELEGAQKDGRLVMQLSLEAVDRAYLIRDRIEMGEEDMAALTDSLRRRGQQTPIEVVDLGGGTYGLISGARRMAALAHLFAETKDDRFATVQALIRQPADRAATYVAMIEENEIRAGLSYYERARIAHKAVTFGVFPTAKEALQSLYAGVSFSKRSKIKSFMALVEAFDEVLCFPAQITERLGLSVVKAMAEDEDLEKRIYNTLVHTPPETPAAEAALLTKALKPDPKTVSKPPEIVRGVHIEAKPGRIVLEGTGVTEKFIARLESHLKARYR
ncbi:ParB N-terminal domain-containing protein [Tateyamaria omphalii]|uniref:ParB/RepB/Spo0J family partition protein n=1 Tax=Tateyamaria omphalii TaxID=299262 RepID=UPI001C99F64F|nr:ParB N-terminal domain-containing protein [Tateyamaria omphalii]MBY5935532.1 ParB N-terminal domain-containing protein [Tateyamaria omphalii]